MEKQKPMQTKPKAKPIPVARVKQVSDSLIKSGAEKKMKAGIYEKTGDKNTKTSAKALIKSGDNDIKRGRRYEDIANKKINNSPRKK